MFKKFLLILVIVFMLQDAKATGEPSTYFQIYVPPNNDAVRRDVALIITAIYDSTKFDIIDDGADGDTDDSKSGILMAGQSYVLYIKDNGINDDARYASGGVLKWDGDYFIVKSDKLIFASQSTNSDWQHDWVPSTDKKSIGQKFIIYSPPFTSSRRDINVFAYENNTTVTFKKISWQPKTNSGFTDINIETATTVFTRTLNIGEDIIYRYPDGRDVMLAGETYMLVADKPITVQYGALFGNERDGGGYVPTSNGSSSGELMYFGVPYQAAGEQEIRIVSWDDANAVKLERYSNGNWITVKDFSLNKMKSGDWVGKTNGNVSFATVFRITCTPGKRVSVFEGNWFETGSPGTSDMATMVSSENGTTSGTKFLTYMAPPGNQVNVINPFTKRAFGQQLTHLFLFAKEGAFVTVKDATTNGTRINKTFTIGAERYADCFLTLTEWQSIQPTGPYLIVESSSPISVMNSNFNDNWMCYTGSSMVQSFTQTGTVSQSSAIPTDTVKVTTYINVGTTVTNPDVQVVVQDGLKVIDSKLTSAVTNPINGTITEQATKTVVDFNNISNLDANVQYKVETNVVASVGTNTGNVLTGQTNTTVETIVTGTVGSQIQQSSTTQVVNVNPANTSKLIFSRFNDNVFSKDSTDSWTASWIDVNKDGYDDIFATDKRRNRPNVLYINNKAGGFTKANVPAFIQDTAISASSTCADIDNDGDIDVLVINNTRKSNTLYKNNGNGTFTKDITPAFVKDVSYYHGAAFADYDNDGNVDLFLSNFFPTKYNELYKNNGSGSYIKELTNVIPLEANQSIAPSWADYDGDGFVDLFVPNGKGYKNSLFHNQGNGTFTKVSNVITNDGGQSVGSCWGDYDNDGDLDLFVTNSNAQGNFFYKNDGNGKFTKITTGDVVTDKGAAHGCSFADVDNDGDLDLYVSTDKNVKFLYMNNGNGTFTKKTDEVITFGFGNAFGHAWSDFDQDGDLDLLVATHTNQPNAIFTNNGNTNNWIQINLIGTKSNKSAIGACVYVKANGIWQMRAVNAQSGFGGQSSLTQHFGLSSTSKIDSIKIKWPSGVVQVLTNITAKQILNITETQSVRVIGGVFVDNNNDGKKDIGEETVSRAMIEIIGSTTALYSTPTI
ncbi:MAG: CRTAC1 family protein [Chitinophagaceae bacterium]|nr:CRTAC1 family protein [Chitinophagaceae bacterium]